MFSLILEGVTANWLSPMHFASINEANLRAVFIRQNPAHNPIILDNSN